VACVESHGHEDRVRDDDEGERQRGPQPHASAQHDDLPQGGRKVPALGGEASPATVRAQGDRGCSHGRWPRRDDIRRIRRLPARRRAEGVRCEEATGERTPRSSNAAAASEPVVLRYNEPSVVIYTLNQDMCRAQPLSLYPVQPQCSTALGPQKAMLVGSSIHRHLARPFEHEGAGA
jgi:hypothetical protein